MLVIPCEDARQTRNGLVPGTAGGGQMAEEVQTIKQDNELVRIAVWYDYI